MKKIEFDITEEEQEICLFLVTKKKRTLIMISGEKNEIINEIKERVEKRNGAKIKNYKKLKDKLQKI